MKLGMVDYVRNPTLYDNFGGCSAAWVVWLCDLSKSLSFFSFFAFFVTRPGCISRPIGTIYMRKLVFLAKNVPFGGLNNI